MSKALNNKTLLNTYLKISKNVYTPLAYGAVGDGVTNDRAACQAASDAARAANGELHFPEGYTFLIDQYIYVRSGVRRISGGGIIKKDATSILQAGIALVGKEVGEALNVTDCDIVGLRIDLNNSTAGNVGIYGQNISRCNIIGNRIYNGASGVGILIRGFLDKTSPVIVNDDPIDNLVAYNYVIMDPGSPSSPPVSTAGIQVDGNADYGGYADAALKWKAVFDGPDVPHGPVSTVITGNHVYGGYYGIGLTGAQYCEVTNNIIEWNMRNISLQNKSLGNLISGNRCRESISSGIHLAYGSTYNQITNNTIYTTRAEGEGLLQAYVGCQHNTFKNNTVTAAGGCLPLYLIYSAIHADNNAFIGNELRGTCAKAYIAIESTWHGPVTNAAHRFASAGSDPNYTGWANASTVDVSLTDNTIRGSSSVPAIFLSQITDTASRDALRWRISDNKIIGNSYTSQLEVYEMTSGSFSNGQLVTNEFDGAATKDKFVLPRGRQHFNTWNGNTHLDNSAHLFTFTNLDTTPSVAVGYNFQCSNGSATSITMFDDGADGQEISVRMDANTTLVHNTSNIRLKGSVNVVTPGSNAFLTFRKLSGIWFETSRNF